MFKGKSLQSFEVLIADALNACTALCKGGKGGMLERDEQEKNERLMYKLQLFLFLEVHAENWNQFLLLLSYTLRNEIGFSSLHGKLVSNHVFQRYCCMTTSLWQGGPSHNKMGIQHFYASITKNDVFRQSHCTKTSKSMQKSQLHLFLSTEYWSSAINAILKKIWIQ